MELPQGSSAELKKTRDKPGEYTTKESGGGGKTRITFLKSLNTVHVNKTVVQLYS